MWNQWSFLLSQPNSFFPREWLQSHTLRSLKGILGILYIWRISVVLVPFVFLLRIKLNPWGTWESLRATVPKICPSAGVLVSRPGGRCLCSPPRCGCRLNRWDIVGKWTVWLDLPRLMLFAHLQEHYTKFTHYWKFKVCRNNHASK